MQIAACYIVKDELEELDRSIHSLRNAVDELVVVNTGTSKAITELARSYRAKVLSFPWQDHFAKARNFALEHVKSPWIIFLDADEFFRHPKEVRPALQEALEKDREMDAIMLLRYNIDKDDPRHFQAYDISLRIMRNSPHLRYRGRIHEMLQKGAEPLKLYYADERLALIHTGYSSGRSKQKGLRNLHLIQREIKEHGPSPFHEYNLSVCYFGMEAYRKALEHALNALDSDMQLVSAQGALYHIAIESMRQLNMPLEDMLSLAEAAIRELPKLPEFYAERGMILSAAGRLEEAKEMLEKAMDIYDTAKVNYHEESYFTPSVAAIVCQRLATLAELRGDNTAASQWSQRALEFTMKS